MVNCNSIYTVIKLQGHQRGGKKHYEKTLKPAVQHQQVILNTVYAGRQFH